MRLSAFSLCVMATPIAAENLTVQFSDGAPKDSITLTNQGCLITDAVFVLDLAGSEGELIFDTTSQGAGVEVFQPVEITAGNAAISPVDDGDKTLQIQVQSLATGGTLRLTADLDDTLEASRQITVTGSEMAGASVSLALGDRVLTGKFDTTGAARINVPADAGACLPS